MPEFDLTILFKWVNAVSETSYVQLLPSLNSDQKDIDTVQVLR